MRKWFPFDNLKALSHWRRRRRDYRDWSVAATRATRETKTSLRSHQSGDVAATAPCLYIYLDLQLDLSFDDVNTRSVTWSLNWVKQRQAVSRRSRCNVSSVSSRSRRRRGDVSSVSSRSRRRRGDVAGTSPQSRVKLVSATNGDVAETSPRPAGDWKKSPKKSNMFDFSATPRRPGLSPGDVAETSPWLAETRVAN